MKHKNVLAVYQAKNGAIELREDTKHETVWATQAQIANIFEVERSVVTKHIRNILKDGELDEKSVCALFAQTALDGKTYQVINYNLDVILSVGYRTNSRRAIEFRQWANKILKKHITQGYTINHSVIKNNYQQFLEAVSNIKVLAGGTQSIDTDSVLELITAFADTWLSLDAYDKDKLKTEGVTKKSITLTVAQVESALSDFKQELIIKGEATDIFARERESKSLEGIIGNVMQSFAGEPLYKTLEGKAAHLLYFIIKNHPFVDGNKRSGAFVFIWFLKKTALLSNKITPAVLTAITLFIAESEPKNKPRMISLVLQLIFK